MQDTRSCAEKTVRRTRTLTVGVISTMFSQTNSYMILERVIMAKVIVALTSAPYVKAQKFKCNLTYSPHMRAATFCKCHKRKCAGMAAGGRKDIVAQARFGDCVLLTYVLPVVLCPMDWRPATDLYHSRLDFAPFARHYPDRGS